MNWYKKARAADAEYPVAAAIIAADKIFEGKSHFDALQKAIKEGYARKNKSGDFVDKDGHDMSFSGAMDWFRTNKGRLITRTEALEMGEAKRSEDIPVEENKYALV